MTIANFRNWCLDCTNSYLRPKQSVMISQLKLDFLLCLTHSKYYLYSAIILGLSVPIPVHITLLMAKTYKCTLVNSKWYNDWTSVFDGIFGHFPIRFFILSSVPFICMEMLIYRKVEKRYIMARFSNHFLPWVGA